MVAIVIEDTGKGIEPSLLQRIFEPFFTTKENGEGSGIGLAITQQIVKRYGGSIHVSSEPNVGTMFTVLFPIDSPLIKQHVPDSLVFG
jgi:signal transduction histidine kinase